MKQPATDSKRIPTGGGPGLTHQPFAALTNEGLPPIPGGASVPDPCGRPPSSAGNPVPPDETKPARKNRGRVDILRVKAGRGGKTVTVVKNFTGIGLPEKEQLARAMQRACGTGGTVKDGQIEIQGDKREEVARILTAANFRPVFAGG
jgi:translation initiation factor 1